MSTTQAHETTHIPITATLPTTTEIITTSEPSTTTTILSTVDATIAVDQVEISETNFSLTLHTFALNYHRDLFLSHFLPFTGDNRLRLLGNISTHNTNRNFWWNFLNFYLHDFLDSMTIFFACVCIFWAWIFDDRKPENATSFFRWCFITLNSGIVNVARRKGGRIQTTRK